MDGNRGVAAVTPMENKAFRRRNLSDNYLKQCGGDNAPA